MIVQMHSRSNCDSGNVNCFIPLPRRRPQSLAGAKPLGPSMAGRSSFPSADHGAATAEPGGMKLRADQREPTQSCTPASVGQ